MQTRVDPEHAASVSVSSQEHCSVDLEDLVLIVSSIPSGPYTISASSLVGFHKFQVKEYDGSLLRDVCSKVYLSG